MTLRQKLMDELPAPYNLLAIIRAEEFRARNPGWRGFKMDDEHNFWGHGLDYAFNLNSTPEGTGFWRKVRNEQTPGFKIQSIKDIKKHHDSA